MLSRCANPDCGAPYEPHRGAGRFFRFRRNSPHSCAPVNSHSVQHHWLCDSCSRTYTLDYRAAIGVLLSVRLRVPDDGFVPLLIAEA
jgi:transposase-like protein